MYRLEESLWWYCWTKRDNGEASADRPTFVAANVRVTWKYRSRLKTERIKSGECTKKRRHCPHCIIHSLTTVWSFTPTGGSSDRSWTRLWRDFDRGWVSFLIDKLYAWALYSGSLKFVVATDWSSAILLSTSRFYQIETPPPLFEGREK